MHFALEQKLELYIGFLKTGKRGSDGPFDAAQISAEDMPRC